MKIRTGFVSNSSASSFVVKINDLSDFQYECLMNVEGTVEFLKRIKNSSLDNLGSLDASDIRNWKIVKDKSEGTITCSCSMNNFDLREMLWIVGVPENKIEVTYED